ncbi:20780_t:CDS:2 [Cetraspora pellucida]|uniref:20780_t:CDS:1 n=1 Tax=Cetraspora pellucida TaxID=1433469 RepID=A0A9N9A920_9GLOM|nr:20780_t:CDS:2 [Cetraspora pellucida]
MSESIYPYPDSAIHKKLLPMVTYHHLPINQNTAILGTIYD